MFCLLFLRATTVISGSPFTWVFQIFWFWNNVAIVCVNAMFFQFLVNAPVWDSTVEHKA